MKALSNLRYTLETHAHRSTHASGKAIVSLKGIVMKNNIRYSIALLTVLLFSLSMSVFASSVNTFHLDELEMSVDIPSELMVITSDASYVDPRFDEIGISTDDLLSMMATGSTYLTALDEDVNLEISVTMTDNEINDFNEYSDTMLASFADSIESEYLPAGITVNNFEIYPSKQVKFIKFDLSQSDGDYTEHGLQYYTVYDHKAINIILRSYSGEIDASKEAIISSIVDSATFDKEPSYMEDNISTESPVFEDSKSGCMFTIPDEWWKSSTGEENGVLYATISSNIEAKTNIVYTCGDIWNELSDAEKLDLPRAQFNNAAVSEDYVAKKLEISSDRITRTTYANHEYYMAVMKSGELIDGSDDGMITILEKVENGYLHMFMFSGDSTSPYYKDFESLMNSVQYADYSDEQDAGVNTSTLPHVDTTDASEDKTLDINYDLESLNDTSKDLDYTFAGIIISLLITVGVYTLPIIIYRYAIVKHPVDKAKAKKITIIYGIIAFFIMLAIHLILNDGDLDGVNAVAVVVWSTVNYNILLKEKKKKNKEALEDTYTEITKSTPKVEPAQTYKESTSESKSVNVESSVIYCHKCGAKLPVDADFCYKCGAKLIKKDLSEPG